MKQVFTNNLVARLDYDIDDLTSVFALTLLSGTWPYIIPPSEYFLLTISDAVGDFEIMRVTDISGDVVTVLRGQEATYIRPWPAAGTVVSGRLTADTLNEFVANDIDFSRRFAETVPTEAARLALTGSVITGKLVLQADTLEIWRYTGTTWARYMDAGSY